MLPLQIILDGFWYKIKVSFDTNTFVEYLNEVHLKDKMEKAIIYKEYAETIEENIKHIYF